MGKKDKLLNSVLSGKKDKNILFTDLCKLLDMMEFDGRINGSHHIYHKDKVDDILNLQPEGKLAKPYQVRQVRELIKKYDLEIKK
ncbi:MAG: type II toxin-antitoxin system HicA family toxin [Oscillospiraceae bacterium]|nr:type II toxin-antitoxin system HicA family toxin [Oscillospiraceae bacterium]